MVAINLNYHVQYRYLSGFKFVMLTVRAIV